MSAYNLGLNYISLDLNRINRNTFDVMVKVQATFYSGYNNTLFCFSETLFQKLICLFVSFDVSRKKGFMLTIICFPLCVLTSSNL